MERTPDPWTSLGLLVLRLGTALLLFLGHGWPKLLNFSGRLHNFPNPIGLGSEASFVLVVFAEVVCVAFIAAGLWTRIATIPLIGFMLIAALIHHAADPWPRKELALLFLVPALTLAITGPGMFSLDALFRRRRKGG